MKPIETVTIRDNRFRRNLHLTASKAVSMQVEDDGEEMRIDFLPERRRVRCAFFGVE